MACSWLSHGLAASTCSWLVHYLLKTCAWLITFSWLLQNLFLNCSFFFHDLSMSCSQLVYNFFITCSHQLVANVSLTMLVRYIFLHLLDTMSFSSCYILCPSISRMVLIWSLWLPISLTSLLPDLWPQGGAGKKLSAARLLVKQETPVFCLEIQFWS